MKGRLAVAGLAALLCAACSSQGSTTFTPGTRVHAMPKRFGEGPVAFAQGNPNLQYFGGPVIPHVKIVAVFWGSNVDSTTTSQIGPFYSAVTDSPYMDWLQEYDTSITAVGGQNGTNQHIGRGSYVGAVTITPSVTGSTIDDADVQTELDAQITAGNLPEPDENTLYMTYFAPGVTITQGGQQSCSAFCAYHGTFLRGQTSAFYGVMPDFGGACSQGCGNGSTFDNLTSASTHEMVEAITDAGVGLAQADAPPLAWYDDQYGEIGDICAGYDDQIVGYTVQQEWSNAMGNCITKNDAVSTPTPTPPPTPTPSPTPDPTATPGTGGHAHGLVPGVGGCDVGGADPSASIIGMLGLLSLLAGIAVRRNG